MTDAFDITGERDATDGGRAPWCEIAQKKISGVKNNADLDRIDMISVYKSESHPFEDTRVGYTPVEENNHVQFNVSGHNNYYGIGITKPPKDICITPAQELGCKMAAADRVAQQLGLSSNEYSQKTCADVNQYAIDLAEELMAKTAAGKHALERFKNNGRRICLGPDFSPVGNIGPLFVEETISIKDDTSDNCLQVESLKEGPTGLKSLIFPGIHYCKLLSPARVIEYYMTDGLKSKSTCLNTDSSIQEILEEFLQ